MLYTEILRSDLPQPQPVEPDPCARLVARRGTYLAYLRRRTSDPDTAEDLLQDFNLKVIQASRRTGVVHNTDAWLSRVLRNTLFDHYRRRDARRRAHAAHATHVTALSTADDTEPDTADAPSTDAQLADIELALARIRPDQAELIRALYLHDHARDRLARQLNISVGTLNVRILRARRAVRDALTALSGNQGAIATVSGKIPQPSASHAPTSDLLDAGKRKAGSE
ncbi:MAG: RNA polymerase sigma factor [Pseudomonadota bacterium]